MLNPNRPEDISRLCATIDWSRRKLEPFRENAVRMAKLFVGPHYSGEGFVKEDRQPANLLQLAANIYLRHLVARAPLAHVTSDQGELKPLAADLGAWMDRGIKGMRLQESLRMCVLNGLFSVGCMKVGVAAVGEIELLNHKQYFSQPFAEPVHLEDLVFDMQAKSWSRIQYAGDRYRVSLEWAKENKLFKKEARERLATMTQYQTNEMGDERITALSQSSEMPSETYEDHVELWDVWLPRERLVLTLPAWEDSGGGVDRVLRVVEWEGPYCGPYHLLSYCDVPNQIMPAAPLQSLIDLHEIYNRLVVKLGRQAERQKTVIGAMGMSAQEGGDAERVRDAKDGEIVKMDQPPDRVAEMRFGGADQMGMLAAQGFKDLFYNLAGNLDSLGGLSAQSGTLGQDQLLFRSAAAQVAEMQDRTRQFLKDIYNGLAFWWYRDPVMTYTASREAEGLDIPVVIPPSMRERRFEDLDIDIDAYSMADSTPEQKSGELVALFQQVIMPILPNLQEAGYTLDWEALFGTLSRYRNMPEIADFLKKGLPPAMQGPQQMVDEAASEPGMPPATTRTNVRVNKPGMTRQGQSDVMSQLLAGGGQPKQASMVGRRT